MNRSLAARIAKLEAQQKIQMAKVIGVIGSAYGRLIVDPDKPGHLKFSEPPGGYEEFARKQQVELQAELVRLFVNRSEDEPP